MGISNNEGKTILEGGLVVIDDGSGSGSGSGATIGDNDASLTIFETTNHYEYDHTDYNDFTTSRECSTCKSQAFKVDVTTEATAKEHSITVYNPSIASKEEEKVEPVSLGERKNYLFEGFNISEGALKTKKFDQRLFKIDCRWAIKASCRQYLSDGIQVPNDGLNAGLLHQRYAALLWKYGETKAQKLYASDIKDPRRPKPNFVAPDEEQLVHIE
ncbi:hypothetical protein T459_23377 [Capsicum annuum]|uniref:Uncharacterized protein n=1 Tax=Capsicum annuum TaxID=4072 RepID=A0A2G2YS76_CAPAN|nr:hypothetical protein T459_23377 [Capsicum annuum]